jgi:sulfur-oxidizing protein SoxY
MQRRHFVKGTLAASVAASTGLLSSRLWAEDATKEAPAAAPEAEAAATTEAPVSTGSASFDAENLADTLKALGAEAAETSDKITLIAPDVAENGAVVPVSIETTLEGATQFAFIAENNARPLSATFDLSPEMAGFVGIRMRMGKTGKVIALVTVGDKIYKAEKNVKVTAGGC